MAAVAHLGQTASTANASSYVSGSMSPTVGDLLVIAVVAAGTTDDTSTLVESAGGGTYTRVLSQAWNGTSARLVIFVADQLCAANTARTFTFDCAADAATGAMISVERVTGMTLAGTAAIVQSGGNKNSAGTTPTFNFAGACNTANAVLVFCAAGANPAAQTEPSGWTEIADPAGFNSPSTGLEVAKLDSGYTGSSVTWGAASTPAWGAAGVELDVSTGGPTTLHSDPLDITGVGTVTVAASHRDIFSGALSLGGASAVTIAASHRDINGGILDVTGAGDITIAASSRVLVGGPLVIVGTGVITIADSHRDITAGLLAVTGNAAIDIAASHRIVFGGLVAVDGVGTITIADSHVGGGPVTLHSDPLDITGVGAVVIADSHRNLFGGPVAVTGNGAVAIADAHRDIFSGPLSLGGGSAITIAGSTATLHGGPLAIAGQGTITISFPLVRNPTTILFGNRRLISENIGDTLAVEAERAEVRSTAAGNGRKRMVSLGSWLLGIRLDYAADVDAGCTLVVADSVRTLLTVVGNTDGYFPVREEIVDNTGAGLSLYEPPVIIDGEVIVTLTGAGAGKSVFVTIFTQ